MTYTITTGRSSMIIMVGEVGMEASNGASNGGANETIKGVVGILDETMRSEPVEVVLSIGWELVEYMVGALGSKEGTFEPPEIVLEEVISRTRC